MKNVVLCKNCRFFTLPERGKSLPSDLKTMKNEGVKASKYYYMGALRIFWKKSVGGNGI